jgi:peroxiredoxin
MKTEAWSIIALLLAGSMATVSVAEVSMGETAPEFTLKDIQGTAHTLSDFKGKFVVLEWTNYDCPFVRKHYDTGNMQELQKTYTEKGVIWLSVNSSAPGKQGNYLPNAWQQKVKEKKAAATAVLLDTDGKVGRLYGAKTTPHVFVIDKEGKLAYKGAIDDKRSWRKEEVATAKNYVRAALEALMAGKSVETPSTAPYGCSVKY